MLGEQSGSNGPLDSFQNNPENNPENQDSSYKMDLDPWDCVGRIKLLLKQNF